MRKLGSYLIILLLLTAYGQCVAGQLGILHSEDSSCCQASCSDAAHYEEKNNDSSDDNNEPIPCKLCVILSNDSVLLQDVLALPTPVFIEITAGFSDVFEDLSPRACESYLPDLTPPSHPDPPALQRSLMQRIFSKILPVRGSSII